MRISDWSSDVCSSDLDMLTTAIKAAQFSEGSFAVYSNQTAQRYPATASAIRALLDQHMLSPVEFVAEIDAMHAAGSRLFVELGPKGIVANMARSEEHTSELQSLMRISYAVFCLKQKKHETMDTYNKTLP